MQRFDNLIVTQVHNTKMNSWYMSLILLSGLVLIADWFFYKQSIGITLPIFISLLGIAGLLSAKKITPKLIKNDALILLTTVLPLIEELNMLTALIGCLGLVSFTFNRLGDKAQFTLHRLSLIILFFLVMPFRFLSDLTTVLSVRRRLQTKQEKSSLIRNWGLPIFMTAGFLFLFTIANPLISNWIQALNFGVLLSLINFERICFWMLIAIISWPFLKPSLQKLKSYALKPSVHKENSASIISTRNHILNEVTVFRSLVLFNLLFAVQTALDFQYLWIGQTLPDGVTFSQYVHNGTYVLIFTTLLAASFILFVTNSKKRLEKSPRIMGLILAWIIQNIILVLSNVMRMELYVEAFALTYLRLTVLIWLALVIIGLVLIILRLYKAHSNLWLIKANLISLSVVLYLTSFANLPYLIADYNYKASQANLNKSLDIQYVVDLGSNTLPILDRILANPELDHISGRKKFTTNHSRSRKSLAQIRNSFTQRVNLEYSDWRQWNLRDYRLAQSLTSPKPIVLP